MATATIKAKCSVCLKETSTFNCDGCSQKFCWHDLTQHRQLLEKQFDHIESDHNQFRQKLLDQKIDVKNHSSIQEVNKWQEDSIKIINQTADQWRQKIIHYTNESLNKVENQLNNLANQINSVREENNFNEIDLNYLKEELIKLQDELSKALNISTKQKSTSFINKIFVDIRFDKNIKWKQNGITVVGESGSGDQLNQLYRPRGIFIDDDEILYITDCDNHRIVQWKPNAKSGRIVIGENGPGNQMNQLKHPVKVIVDKENNSLIIADRVNRRVMRWSRQINTTNGEIIISDTACRDLAMDKDGSLYVCDGKKNEVKRWKKGETNGTVVAGGNGEGEKVNQLNFPAYIFVNDDYSLYISDENNHRVMKWEKDAKEGTVVAGGNGQGSSLCQLSSPQAIVVDQFGQIYVADWDNHRVIRWCEGEKEGSVVVGGNGQGKQSNQFYNPQGLSFDTKENLYVADCNNNRIQKFKIDFN